MLPRSLSQRTAAIGFFLAPTAIAIDIVWEPTDLILGVPTTVSIYFQTNDSEFAYALGGFGLVDSGGDGTPGSNVIPDGGLFFDTDGPDNIELTSDDGWAWQGGLEGEQFAQSLVPLEVSMRGVVSPFRVPPNDRLLAATLKITGTSLGDFRLVPMHEHVDESLGLVAIKDGAEPVFHVVPVPPTAALLAVGAIGAFRRRSDKRVGSRAY